MPATLSKALSSAALYAIALVAAKGVSFVMLPVVTSHLSPSDYGVLEILISVADIGGLVLGLGLADAVFRFGRESGTQATLLGMGGLLGLAMLGVGWALAPEAARLLPGAVGASELRILAATLALTALIQVPFAHLRFRDRPAVFALVSIAKAVFQATCVFLFLDAGFGVTAVLLGGLIADGVASAILVWLQARETGLALDPVIVRRVLPYSLPLVVSGMFGFCLGSLDRWFLAVHVEAVDIALYGLAAKFGLLTALAMQPFEMWWYPRRLGLLDTRSDRRASADCVAVGLVWALLAAAGVASTGPVVIAWMTPETYHAAARYVPWLALIALLHAATNLLNVGCYVGRTTVLPMLLNGAAALVAGLGYALLIPGFGVAGAIAATILAQLFRLTAFHIASQRRRRIPHRVSRLALVGTAGVVVFILQTQLNLLFLLPLSSFVVLGTSVALGLVRVPRRGRVAVTGESR